MSDPLWTLEAFVEAVSGRVVGDIPNAIVGISIDSRTIEAGEAFIAIKGDRFDGHDYVSTALEADAALALVSEDFAENLPEGGRYVVVDDPLEAMRQLGIAARARSSARIVAVTGSVGKTGTKEALKLALEASGKVHASVASFNNHWGVPLTLARMPADAEFGVFEIGMNHAGEIPPLVKMVRPHVVIITTVQAVHLEFFDSVEQIAGAKAEIFHGLEPDGVAILNKDNKQYDLLKFLAFTSNVSDVQTFGQDKSADSHVTNVASHAVGSSVDAVILGQEITYKIGAPGQHHVKNSLAVLTAVVNLGADLAKAGLALEEMRAPKGRGERIRLELGTGEATLIDESYNANPASMRAALAVLGEISVELPGRRVAVLGDMLELGTDSDYLHADLLEPIQKAGVDVVFCSGPHMRSLWDRLPETIQGQYFEKPEELEDVLLRETAAGDAIMVKGSLGSRMGPLVEALKREYSLAEEDLGA